MAIGVLPIFIRVVVATGGVVLAHSLAALFQTPHPLEWMLFAALAVTAGTFTISTAPAEASLTVSDTFFIASSLLFGPAPATVTIALDSLLLSWRKRHSWQRVAFNTTAPSLAMWAAATAFFRIAHVEPLSVQPAVAVLLIAPLVCLTIIYFLVNSSLTAVAIGLESGQSPFTVWRGHFQWLSVGYLASASVALCLVIVFQQAGLIAVGIVLPVLAVFHLTARATFGRVEDAERHVAEVNRLYTSTIETLAMAIDAKDDVTHSHVRRVQAYAGAIAEAMGVTDEPVLRAIEAAALLHDTGKLAVPEHILNKPGALTASEFEEMKRHVDIGADILSLVEFPFPVVPIVRCHHENWDGSGYPRGVAGQAIPIGARILAVADCFDALTSDRPYRKRLSNDAAFQVLRERRGTMYDPDVVDTFIRIYRHIPSAAPGRAKQTEVLRQISRSHQPTKPPSVPQAADSVAAPGDLLAFVSVARLATGSGTTSDVLALSTGLIRTLVPKTSGAWFVPNAGSRELNVAAAFGPAASVLNGLSIRVGEKLTGWVAANERSIVNSDPVLDLGDAAAAVNPRLRSSLSVPLKSGEVLVGVLTLYASEPFTDDQERLLGLLAPHVAQGLDLARHAAEPQRVTRDLRLVSKR